MQAEHPLKQREHPLKQREQEDQLLDQLPTDQVSASSFPLSRSMPLSSQWACYQMAIWQYLHRIHGMGWAGINMAHIREREGVQSLMGTLIDREDIQRYFGVYVKYR